MRRAREWAENPSEIAVKNSNEISSRNKRPIVGGNQLIIALSLFRLTPQL